MLKTLKNFFSKFKITKVDSPCMLCPYVSMFDNFDYSSCTCKCTYKDGFIIGVADYKKANKEGFYIFSNKCHLFTEEIIEGNRVYKRKE